MRSLRWGGGGPKSNDKCQEKRKRPHKGENDMKMEEEIERIHL